MQIHWCDAMYSHVEQRSRSPSIVLESLEYRFILQYSPVYIEMPDSALGWEFACFAHFALSNTYTTVCMGAYAFWERGLCIFTWWIFVLVYCTCVKITRIRFTSIHSLTCINMCFSSSDEQKLVTFWTLWYSYSSSFEPARMPVESQWTFLIIPIFRVPLKKQRKIFFFKKKKSWIIDLGVTHFACQMQLSEDNIFNS